MADQLQTPLERALTEVCEFAKAHGVDASITPADFGIQRSHPGVTIATRVDADHAVHAVIDRYGRASFGVAELFWLHDDSDEDRDVCDYCEVIEPRAFVDVYLPGDGPARKAGHE